LINTPKYTKFSLRPYIRDIDGTGSQYYVTNSNNLLKLNCESTSTTIVSTILAADEHSVMQFQPVLYTVPIAVYPWSTIETEYGFQFIPFSCSRNPGCCPYISYQLSTTNGAIPTLVADSLYSITLSSDGTKKVLNILDRTAINAAGTVYYIYATTVMPKGRDYSDFTATAGVNDYV